MTSTSDKRPDATFGGWFALFVLTVVTLFAFLDRGVFVLLAEPIRKALSLSDLQLGLVMGTGVLLFASVASFPLALLADRFGRRIVLIGCLLLWSASVAACGLAHDFLGVFLASAIVGAGEAGLGPIINSMIPDLFHGRSRQIANSVFALAASGGGALALILCGQMIGAVEAHRAGLPFGLSALSGWRLSFFAAALPAPFMILLVAMIVRPRTVTRAAQRAGAPALQPGQLSLLGFACQNQATFVGLFGGGGLSTIGFGAVTGWLVIVCMRLFGQTAAQVATGMGSASLLALPLGFVLSILFSRIFSGRVGKVLPLRMVWIALLLAAGLLSAMLFAANATQIYLIWFFITLSAVSTGMVMPTAIQGMTPSHLRARFFSISSIIAWGSGALAAPLVGFASDRLKSEPHGLLLAAIGVAAPSLLIAAALMRWSEPHYVRTAERAAGE